MKFKSIVSSSMCGLLLASASMAQDAGQGRTDPAPRGNPQQNPGQVQPGQVQPGQVQPGQIQPGQNQGAQQHQRMIATCLVIDNQEEVLLSRFAAEKVQNKEVAAFAKKLIEAHTKVVSDLNRIDPSLAQTQLLSDQAGANADRSTTKAQPTSTNSGNNQNNPTQNNQNVGASNNELTRMQLEIAQQCLADSEKKLSKDDDKVDECFVGMQIAKHAAMHSKLTVFQRHATGELKEIVSKGLEMTKEHLEQAESLMKKLDKENDKDSDDSKSDRRSK